jgi:Holliday junction resolvase RusA-like endonuclease
MRKLEFSVPGQPPIKNEATSVVENPRHGYASQARDLLAAAEKEIRRVAWQPAAGRIGLEMIIFKPDDPAPDPKRRRPDATNYLGSIGDLLEDKLPRESIRPGCLDHLGPLKHVTVFMNDEQIKEIHYRVELSAPASYTIRIWTVE